MLVTQGEWIRKHGDDEAQVEGKELEFHRKAWAALYRESVVHVHPESRLADHWA